MKIETKVSKAIEFASGQISSSEIEKLIALGIFCDPLSGELDRILFLPLKQRTLPDGKYSEFVFTISEDINLLEENASNFSLELIFYITILDLHCEYNHEVNYSGYVLAIFLYKAIAEEQVDNYLVKFLYTYVDSIYGFESLSSDKLLDFNVRDEVLVLIMHYYALTLKIPNSILADQRFSELIDKKIKAMCPYDRSIIWGKKLNDLIAKITARLIT